MIVLTVGALAFALALTGCGNFWQNPYGTGGGTTASTTTLTASPTSVAVKGSVTLTATVSPSAATGTVTFYNNSTSIGTGTLSSGTATLTTTFAAVGTESLTATYGGDSTYESSTSSAVTVTVTSSSSSTAFPDRRSSRVSGAARSMNAPSSSASTSVYRSAVIHAISPFTADGGTYSAKDAEAVVVERDGSVTFHGSTLNGAGGDGRGVLMYQGSANWAATLSFAMVGGSISYDCDGTTTPACAEDSHTRGQNRPAALFSVANARATISLADVTVANHTSTPVNSNGTLLAAGALEKGSNGGSVSFRAQGTGLTGDVIVDSLSTVAISILQDAHGKGSSLTGAINQRQTGKSVTLALDPASLWIMTGTSYVTSLDGLDLSGTTVNNIDGGGHCVYYSSKINGSDTSNVFSLGGSGGYLAPKGTLGLACR